MSKRIFENKVLSSGMEGKTLIHLPKLSVE